MKKYKETEKGFYGCYWPCPNKESHNAIIAMLGDDCEDHVAKSGVRWIHKKFGVNVMTLSPAHKDYSHHNLPVERIGAAIEYLKDKGNTRFGIAGASTTGMYALIASSFYSEITLTIAMTPSDFVMEGFYRGKKDGCDEWPGEGESTASWKGEPLPYLPFVYRHPEYYQKMKADAKVNKDMIVSRGVFDDSEKAHPIREEEFIKVERIKGKLLLIGAEDDVLWDTAKYIRRMEGRLSRIPHECEVESMIYDHATHFVFPESLLKEMLPIGGSLFVGLFKAGRDYKKECKEARIDIDRRMSKAINDWIKM